MSETLTAPPSVGAGDAAPARSERRARPTGLLAGYALLVLVALTARIPALERGIGADRPP